MKRTIPVWRVLDNMQTLFIIWATSRENLSSGVSTKYSLLSYID